jgi:hypothetical protein
MFKVEVIADNSGKWCSNALTFQDIAMAVDYAKNLMSRWTLVSDWRVIEVKSGRVVQTMEQSANLSPE